MSKVVKSVKKAVSKVVSSPVGKIALAAAAIYTGGAALGAWGAGAAGSAAGATALSEGAVALGSKGALLNIGKTGFSLGSVLSAGKTALSGVQALSALSGIASPAQKMQIMQDNAPLIAAARRAEAQQLQSLNQQEDVVRTQSAEADKQAEELSAQLAAQKNAVLARRRGRGGLAFSGPVTGLKTTFGG